MDFRNQTFLGSDRHTKLAHSLDELKTVCRCGCKVVFNTRKDGE